MIEAAQGTALSFRIALLTQKYCYFIASVSLGGKGTSCSHISSLMDWFDDWRTRQSLSDS